jgi:mannose-6-phosphate isomerase-like protein (cupin superfamily)
MSEQDPGFLDTKFMVDPYLNWVKAEGAPIVSAQALDLFAVEVNHWPRFGMKGAVCHIDGRCDFLTAFLFELAAGASSGPVRHVHEEAFYVLSGAGETEITLSNGMSRTIAWGEKKLFAVPVNATARHRASGQAPARFVTLSDFRYLMGLYRNEAFLFANSAPMHERQARACDAGLIADPMAQPLSQDELTPLRLADMTVGVDLTTLAPRASTLARRQMQGRHILGVDGAGFTLSFSSESSDLQRTDWKHGVLAGLGPMRFHQHFNAGAAPARFVSVEMGSMSSPMFRSRRAVYGDTEVYASGAAIIPRDDERPDVRAAL